MNLSGRFKGHLNWIPLCIVQEKLRNLCWQEKGPAWNVGPSLGGTTKYQCLFRHSPGMQSSPNGQRGAWGVNASCRERTTGACPPEECLQLANSARPNPTIHYGASPSIKGKCIDSGLYHESATTAGTNLRVVKLTTPIVAAIWSHATATFGSG